MSRAEILGLIRACDAYVSLHRSEGFGMGLAEAMSFGRVAIATDFSGNTDFMTSRTGFPVQFTLRRVAIHEYQWSTEQVWAEPDLDSAASAMETVWRFPDMAWERAKAGQKLVQQKYATTTVGEMMKTRIAYLMSRGVGEVLKLLGIWRGASFACESATGFGKPSKGAPHGDEITCFAAHAGRVDGVDRGSSFHSFSEGRTG
jgi:hypothetical protein